jgi:hypothetical protein
MYKLIALSVFAALTQAQTFLNYDATAWPEGLVEEYIFQTDATLFTWDGAKLSPYKDITATIKVDSDRNKIKVDAKVAIPLFGKVDAQILNDFTKGVVYEYVPFLGICQKTSMNGTFSLRQIISTLYSPTAGVSVYDGETTAPWDKTKMYKFHGTGPDATVSLYFDETTKNGKWIHEVPTDTSNPVLVASIPKGEVKTTFKDSDFVISGCNSYSEDPATRFNIWRD